MEVVKPSSAPDSFGGLSVGKCTRCQRGIKLYSEKQPSDGMHLQLLDGYGMFTDSEEVLEDVLLCHDCVVWFLQDFPEEYKQQFKNGHGPGGDCSTACEYAYKRNSDSPPDEEEDNMWYCDECGRNVYSCECTGGFLDEDETIEQEEC